jgi:hypothetical protein
MPTACLKVALGDMCLGIYLRTKFRNSCDLCPYISTGSSIQGPRPFLLRPSKSGCGLETVHAQVRP